MKESEKVIFGSFLPMTTVTNSEKNHFKTFEEIAKFSDKMKLIEEYKNMQEELLRNIGIPKDYLDAAEALLGLKE